MKNLAKIYKALADETRLMIIALIVSQGECCVCDVMEVLSLTQSKASRHLRYLKNAGVLSERRAGLWVYYKITKEPGAHVLHVLKSNIEVIRMFQPEELLSLIEKWKIRKTEGEACSTSRARNGRPLDKK